MNKREKLQAARDMEGDCTIGAGAGFGKYTRAVSELRRRRIPRSPRIQVDCDPSEGT